jgi:HlyD family secretion protein
MKKSLITIAFMGALALLLAACGGKSAAGSEQATTEPAKVIAEGRLLPVKSLDLSFSVPGQVAEVLTAEGERVRSGQVLVRLADSAQAQSALASAQKDALAAQQALDDYKAAAQVNLAQAQLEAILARKKVTTARDNYNAGRSTETKARLDEANGNLVLAEQKQQRVEVNGGLDPEELHTLEARVAAANAAVESAQEAVDALELTASMTGNAADVRVLPGQRVAAGEIVMAVADFSQWVVETDNLTEIEVVNIKVGQPVSVVLDALPETPLKGEVTFINERFEEKRGDITYTVTVALTQTDSRMRWGMTAAVHFDQP